MTSMIARPATLCPTWCRSPHVEDALLHDGMPEPLLETEDGDWMVHVHPSRLDNPDGSRGRAGVVLTATSLTCEPTPGRPLSAAPFLTANDWVRLADAVEDALVQAHSQ